MILNTKHAPHAHAHAHARTRTRAYTNTHTEALDTFKQTHLPRTALSLALLPLIEKAQQLFVCGAFLLFVFGISRVPSASTVPGR